MGGKILAGKALAATLWASALIALATSAQAAPVTSHEPTSVSAALLEGGYKAKVSTNDEGDPKIDTASGGNDIILYFSGCTGNKSCDQIEFLAVWDCSDSMKKCANLHVKWNQEELFSKTIIVDKSIVLYRHLLFDKAGISSDLFLRNLDLFSEDATALMAKF